MRQKLDFVQIEGRNLWPNVEIFWWSVLDRVGDKDSLQICRKARTGQGCEKKKKAAESGPQTLTRGQADHQALEQRAEGGIQTDTSIPFSR